MVRKLSSRTFIVVVFFFSASLQGAEDVSRVIPRSAYGVATIKNLEDANAKAGQVMKLVGQPPLNLLALTEISTGIGEGIDRKGTVAVAILPGTDAAPTPVFFVPVSNYAALKKQLSPDDPQSKNSLVTDLSQETIVV